MNHPGEDWSSIGLAGFGPNVTSAGYALSS
jgi:hypothetical protein